MRTLTIEAQNREHLGKEATHRYRREGFVPGVLYGGEKEFHFLVSSKELKPVIYTAEFMKIELNLNGQKYLCILKDVQFDKVTDNLIHIDLLELVPKKKLKATIPLKLVGTSAGVKAGGKLLFKLRKVKVATTPEKLQEQIEVDITNLAIGGNIRIKDIQVEGLAILNPPKIPVVGVVLTRALKQEAATEAKVAK